MPNKPVVYQPEVDSVFKYNKCSYKCVDDPLADCEGCAFNQSKACLNFECRAEERDDMRNVKYEKVKPRVK